MVGFAVADHFFILPFPYTYIVSNNAYFYKENCNG